MLLRRAKRRFQIPYQIIHVLDAAGEADEAVVDADLLPYIGGNRRVILCLIAGELESAKQISAARRNVHRCGVRCRRS